MKIDEHGFYATVLNAYLHSFNFYILQFDEMIVQYVLLEQHSESFRIHSLVIELLLDADLYIQFALAGLVNPVY